MPGGADRGADRVRKGLKRLEARLVEKAAASAHDHAGGDEFGTIRLGFGKADEAGAVIAFRSDHFLDGGVSLRATGSKAVVRIVATTTGSVASTVARSEPA